MVNVAVDALSRTSNGELFTMLVSTVSTNIMEEIKRSWEQDKAIQGIIVDLKKDLGSHPQYKWANNHLNRKGKTVVDNDPILQHKLIFLYHDITKVDILELQ
jgi:hypothetical protein